MLPNKQTSKFPCTMIGSFKYLCSKNANAAKLIASRAKLTCKMAKYAGLLSVCSIWSQSGLESVDELGEAESMPKNWLRRRASSSFDGTNGEKEDEFELLLFWFIGKLKEEFALIL
jgi:hypothetical protein